MLELNTNCTLLVTTKVGLGLAHGNNFGWMPFLTPPVTHHRQRSTVLTVTLWVSGEGGFLTPTESKPLNRLPKKLAKLIGSVGRPHIPYLVTIHSRGTSGQIFDFFFSFFSSTLTDQTL